MRRTDGPFPIWEILPGQLYQRGKLHGMDLDRKTAGLKHYGITHAVALAPPMADPDFPIRYNHHSIPDGVFRERNVVQSWAETLALEIEGGETVLTMCNAGRNRSGLLSALIIRELFGIPGASAMEIVRLHRPNALANPNFERFLEGLS